jgi:hypothetical protein
MHQVTKMACLVCQQLDTDPCPVCKSALTKLVQRFFRVFPMQGPLGMKPADTIVS